MVPNLVHYLLPMKTITLKDIRTNGSKAIPDNEVSYLIVNSEPKSAFVPIDLFEMYVDALEELEDIKTTLLRMKESNTPADKVFSEILGDD